MRSPHLVSHLADGPPREDQFAFGATIPADGIQNVDNNSTLDNSSVHDFSNTMVLHKNLIHNYEDLKMQSLEERNSDNCKSNGMLNILASGQAATDNSGFSQLSSPSTTSFSPNRYLTCQHCSPKMGDSASYSFFTPFSHSYKSISIAIFSFRYQTHGELFNPQFSLSGQGLMPVSELNNSSNLKQVLTQNPLILESKSGEQEFVIF